MIKVICIKARKTHGRAIDLVHRNLYRTINSNGDYKPLIVGNVYDAEEVADNSYIIDGWWQRKIDFILLSEHRNNQINKIIY